MGTVSPSWAMIRSNSPATGDGHFHGYLVGHHLDQRVVPFDAVAGLLEPLADGAFDDAFADVGEFDQLGHGIVLTRIEIAALRSQ